jgi:murein L,D-transpeptidase YafK
MPRARTIVLTVVGLAVVTVAAVVGWDLLKPAGLTIPPLAAPDQRATSILVEKQARRMTLLRNGTALKRYDISLGGDPVGHKQQEGDSRTPEGRYLVDFKNDRSRFHLSMRVSYPNANDRERARRRGVPPGSDIMIHGLPNGLGWLGRWQLARDWTDGCIAVTNTEVEEIWSIVDVGTPIEIRP